MSRTKGKAPSKRATHRQTQQAAAFTKQDLVTLAVACQHLLDGIAPRMDRALESDDGLTVVRLRLFSDALIAAKRKVMARLPKVPL